MAQEFIDKKGLIFKPLTLIRVDLTTRIKIGLFHIDARH